MKAFVTGSTGLLGSNLVRALVAAGWEVKALARSVDKAEKFLGDLDIQFVQGDLLDVARFAHHLAGSDALFHAAAFSPLHIQPGEEEKLHNINVRGTIDLLAAAAQNHVGSVVYVSTVGVLDARAGEAPTDETAPYDYDTPNPAFKSKIAVEEAIYKFLENNDLRIIFILPSALLGPGDSVPTPVGQSVVAYLEGKFPAILPGGFWFVDARDIAQAMIRAVDAGSAGERFIVAGNYYTMESFTKTLEKVSAVKAPSRRVPYPVALAIASLMELHSRFTGKPPQLTRVGLKALVEEKHLSSGKAAAELQVQFRPLEDTLRDQVDWFRTNGYSSR